MKGEFEQLKRAIARVVAGDGKNRRTGTGFLIGEGMVVTALHVVADPKVGPPVFRSPIELHFLGRAKPLSARICDRLWSVDDDWVVMQCENPGAAPLEPAEPPAQGAAWLTFGYPDIRPSGMTMAGTVRDPYVRGPGSAELPAQPLLQLFAEEAAAGQGAPLHGFSGAPCLVGGKVAGVLRSTLVQELYDSRMQRLLFTQAGTVYATPVASLVDWQADRRLLALPGAWAPSTIVTSDFVVLLSQHEPEPSEGVLTSQRVRLSAVASEAYRLSLKSRGLAPPLFLSAAKAFESEQALMQFVRVLCGAKVIVFDGTGFEPAIMLLLGIRSVVRRGVTLISVGGNYALGKPLDVPFNVKDANIVAHSQAQNRYPQPMRSIALMMSRIERSLRELSSSQYADLPVYDAIRRLPPERRGIIPNEEGVLVLCSFDKRYASFWDDKLKPAFENEMNVLREARPPQAKQPLGVVRSFELNSPRQVTQAVFEHIRRVQSCVVDLSGWSPNVLFELGVRLAASGQRTACLLERGWEERKALRAEWKRQCANLAALLVDPNYIYDPAAPFEGQIAFSSAYGRDERPTPPLLDGRLHALVQQVLDIEAEPASRPVYMDLLDQAALFRREPGRSKPVGLFPGNQDLVRRETTAELERLLAAWYYISQRYEVQEILDSQLLRDSVEALGQELFSERHKAGLPGTVAEALGEMMDRIEDSKEQHG